MRKTNKMKTITVAAGLALAMVVGTGNTTKAFATTGSYLSAPTLSTTAPSGTYFEFTVNGSNSPYYYATPNSSYGNTVPTVPQLSAVSGIPASQITSVADGANNTAANVPTFFSTSGLSLTQIATETNAYTMGTAPGTQVTGSVISNVFQIQSGSTMSGATPGDLIFTYQFDVTGVASINNTGVNSASVGYFNNPNGQLFNVGSGINDTAIGTTFSTGTEYQINPGNLTGNVTYASNGSISALDYTLGGNIAVGDYTPQFFVATNAMYYTNGTIGFTGSGLNGGTSVFVPGTPEPTTVVLFGTGVALLGLMAFRKRVNTLTI